MKTPKPFITSLQNGTTKNSTLVGVMTENKNPFNNKFNSVVEKLELSQVKLDSFIGNVMVIPT